MANGRKTAVLRNGTQVRVPAWCAAIVAVVQNTRTELAPGGFGPGAMLCETRTVAVADPAQYGHGMVGTYQRSLANAHALAAAKRRAMERGYRAMRNVVDVYVVEAR